MKQHTAEFKQELTKMGKQIDSVITYTLNNETITLHDELYAVTPMFEGNLLKSVMKQLDVESSVMIPYGTLINYKLGVLVGNTYEYLDYGNFIVYSNEKQEDTNTYKITCFDKMLNSMKPYEEITGTYPMSIKTYLGKIATKIGLTLKDTNFYNYSLQIHEDLYKDLDYTYRDVLDEIAQATGSFIVINEYDQIEVKYPSYTGDTINEDFFKDTNVNFSRKYGPVNVIVLSRSGESDNVHYPAVIPENPCEIKIVDNQIMNFNDRSDYLEGIYNALGGIEYYENDYDSVGVLYYDLGDYYDVQIGNKTYRCLMLNTEINVTSGIEEIIHTDFPEESETDYTKADKTDRRINQTYLIVDKQNQTIESVVSNVSDQNTKISQLTQTVDDLTAQISDISDITTYGESSYASVDLTDINESEPIMLKVHPTTQSISYLYPRDGLYPSDTLYMPSRSVRFTRTYVDSGTNKTEYIDYELPDDLLFYNDTVYDEFYLDYESQTCQVTKRCKYNADGTVSALATEVVHTYPYPEIALGEGNYTISLLGYQYGYIYVRLMAKNIYTTQYYTKVETNSLIRQTANSIDLSVNQKLTNYSTTNEMNSAISLKANEITASVNETTDTKLTNYYTKTQTETKISQSATSITSSVSATYETKTDATTKLQTAKDYTDTNVTTLNSRITQTSNSITAEVTRAKSAESTLSGKIELKIDKDDNNQIISMINASANRITLTAGRLVITSGNFKLDASGNVTCTNGNFSGTITATNGSIGGFNIGSHAITCSNGTYYGSLNDMSNEDFLVIRTGTSGNYNYPFFVHRDGYLSATNAHISGTITASNLTNNTFSGGTISNSSYTASGVSFSPSVSKVGGFTTYNNQMLITNNYGRMGLGLATDSTGTYTNNLFVEDSNGDYWTTIRSGGLYTNGEVFAYTVKYYNLSPVSREEDKKDFEKLNNDEALKIVLSTDIYKYRYKQEEKNSTKRLGFVIGENYKYSKSITAKENGEETGADIYSMTSACYGAIQKLYKEIERIKEKVL